MTPATNAFISVIIVSLISFVGLLTIKYAHPKKKSLFFLVSFAAGALLGDVFIHLLPELGEEGNLNLNTSLYILAAIVLFFIVEKYIHWHHHASEDDEVKHHTSPFVFTNLLGDGIHNFIDGMIIAGAYLIDFKLGVATTVAVVLHEIPQEFADYGVLVYGGLKPYKALFYNFLSAIMSLAGAVVVLAIGMSEQATIMLIAFGAGTFIYLATADLIPEIHRDKSKNFTQLFSFGLGIAVMFLLLYIE